MGNGLNTGMENALEPPEDTSGASGKSQAPNTAKRGSKNLSTSTTTAAIQKDSPPTSPKTELTVLKSKIGLVAGALADFQSAGGTVVRQEFTYNLPSGSYKAFKFLVAVKEFDLVAVQTDDGIDLTVVGKDDL